MWAPPGPDAEQPQTGAASKTELERILSSHLQQQQQQYSSAPLSGANGSFADPLGPGLSLESLMQLQQHQAASASGGFPNDLASLAALHQPQLPPISHKVKVACENCEVLLEVEVPANHPAPSMIVRCGNCSSLLEVMLGGQRAPVPQNPALFSNGGLPFNQYNMLHHQNMNFGFDNVRAREEAFAQQQPEHDLSIMMGMRGKRGEKKRRRQKDPNKPKKLSKYNLFVSKEVKRLKSTGKDYPYKEMFRMAAAAWKNSPENPANAGRFPPKASADPFLRLTLTPSLESGDDAKLVVLKLSFSGEVTGEGQSTASESVPKAAAEDDGEDGTRISAGV